MRKQKNLIALLLIIVSLLSVSLNARALVLCIGADGHTALETSVAGVCGDAQPDASRGPQLAVHVATSVPVIEELHCGPCQDLAALSKVDLRRPESLDGERTLSPPSFPATLAEGSSWLPDSPFTAVDRSRLSSHFSPPALPYLRTIVLLI
jgi:hypothetical protein